MSKRITLSERLRIISQPQLEKLSLMPGIAANLVLVVMTWQLVSCASPEDRAADYLEEAQQLFDEGDFVNAKLEARNAGQLEPKNAQVRYLLALIAEQEEDYRDMVGHLLLAIDADPSFVDARVKLGDVYLSGEAYDRAAEQATEALRIAPNDAPARLLNARLLLQRGDPDAALREAQSALTSEPDYLDAILLEAMIHAADDPGKGLEGLDAAIARLPERESKPLRQARILILSRAGRADEVETELRNLMRDFPDDPSYQFDLARIYSNQGRVDEAEQMLRKLIEHESDDPAVQLAFIDFLERARGLEAAEDALRAAIERAPEADGLRIALGRYYETFDRYSEAEEAYQVVARRSPKTDAGLTARNRIAAIRLQQKAIQDADMLLAGILADDPANVEALVVRGGLRFRDQRYQEALGDLRIALRQDPKEERALLLIARTHARLGETALAADAYRRLLKIHPDQPDATRELAGVELANENFDEAEMLFREHLEREPQDIASSVQLIALLRRQGYVEEALAEARRLTTVDEGSGVGYFQVGAIFQSRGDYAEAIAAYQRALDVAPRAELALEGLIRSMIASGQTEPAIQYLQSFLSSHPDSIVAQFLLGASLAENGEAARAEEMYEKVLATQPRSPLVYRSLAALHPDDREQRIAIYQRGLESTVGDPDLTVLLANEFVAVARFEEAIAVYEQHLEADPDFDVGANNLAALLLQHREDAASIARALEISRRFVDSDNPVALDTLGWAYYRSNDPARAIQYLERAITRAGDSQPVFHYHLGMAYLATEDTVRAEQHLRRALANPDFEFTGVGEARRALDSIAQTS